jgi:hypothetical protein
MIKSNASSESSDAVWRANFGRNAIRVGASTLIVYLDNTGTRGGSGRLSIERRNALRKEIWRTDVVCRRPFEVLTLGKLEHPIVVPRTATVDIIPKVANTWIAVYILATDCFGAIA